MIFLIGENGFLGSAIKRTLKEKKLRFIGINKKNYKNFVGKKCDVLINASTNSKKFIANEDYQKDYKLTVNNVINTINDFDFSKYILVSSSEVYQYQNIKNSKENYKINPDNLSNYGLNKFIAENILKRNSRNWLIIRCGGMIGNNLKKNPIFDLINKKKLRVSLKSKFQFIDTKVVSDCILKLISKEINNEIFNLSAKGNISLDQVVKKFKLNPIIDNTNLPKLNYNINTNKISRHYKINTTEYYLYNYLTSLKLNDHI